jgi:pimeloyl-ACP methyl ester carboxylesterase
LNHAAAVSGGVTTAPALHDSGKGPALLFLHAFPLDSSQWDHQVASLSGSRRCLRYDLWGCGSSPPPPPNAASLDDFAAALLQDLDARGVERFAVVGMSMGGHVAFALWRARRERISALVLCSTRASADSEISRADRMAVAARALSDDSTEFMVESNVERLLGAAARSEPHVTDPLRARIRRCSPAGIAFAQRAMAARPDSTALLDGVDVPALVITGRADSVIDPAEQLAMSARIPDARHLEMECGHLPNLELPYEFNDLIEEFLVPVR